MPKFENMSQKLSETFHQNKNKDSAKNYSHYVHNRSIRTRL